MTHDTPQPHNNQNNSSTVDRLFERIEAESITPTPKMKFMVTEWVLWFMWVLTVIFGATALAITGYVAMSAQYALYEATHENFLTFIVEIMPYIWLFLFALMTYISVYEIKKTKYGYRYSTFLILSSNVGFTILGAILLHSLGWGYSFDSKLGEKISVYMSLEKKEQLIWQKPTEGRLVGVLESFNTSVDTQNPLPNFKDSNGVLWRLDITELNEQERLLLSQSLPVRLLGTTTDEFSFHVCGVFPWFDEGRAMSWQEMREHRAEFDALLDKVASLEGEIKQDSLENSSRNSLCATSSIIKRKL